MKKRWAFVLGGAAVAGLGLAFGPELLGAGPTASLGLEQQLSGGHLAGALALIYAGGVLTALTPCVYPLIPITLSVFGARQAGRLKGAALTTSYVLGMAAMFTTLGVAAAKSGQAFGSLLGNPIAVLAIAALMGALAASMFGAFEIALPPALAQKLNTVGGAGYLGSFLMGLVAGLVAAPCTGPVLSGVLLFVAKSQNTALGALLLFVYALGVGLPFFLLGIFSIKLPKSGAWMESVKSVLGIALIALAFGYLRDAFPAVRGAIASLGALGPATLVGAGAAALGVLAGGVHLSFHGPAREKALKAAGVALLALGLLVRTSAASPQAAETAGWRSDLPASLESAKRASKPVLIDFGAEWCAACKELERLTYPDPRVRKEAQRFVLVKVDGTKDSDELQQLYERFEVQGLPTVVFVDSHGAVLDKPRVTGFMPPERFLEVLKTVN